MLDYKRDIEPYLQLGADGKPQSRLYHAFYQASIDHRDRLREAFGKKYPFYLDFNRPKERDEYRLYRRKIYKNPLRSLRRRVVEVLDYIRQADDFQVSFPSGMAGESTDSLESYLTAGQFSPDGNAESWYFKNIRKKYVGDPNAVLVVLPLEQPESDTVRAMPKPLLIDCDKVYQHRNGEFAVLESPERVWIDTPDGRKKTGTVLIFVDHDSYTIATQTGQIKTDDVKNPYALRWQIQGMAEAVDETGNLMGHLFQPLRHECPQMPARKIGKLQEEQAELEFRSGYTVERPSLLNTDPRYQAVESNDLGEQYFESILADSLPHVESAQATQSDAEVERNFHVSSQEWRYAQKRCPDSAEVGGKCNGGKVYLRDGDGLLTDKSITCPTCKGSGMDVTGSGLGLIIVSAPQATSLQDEGRPTNLPTPPGGFIPRSIDPLKEFVLEYEREKKQAYETINMQFLMETPINQSGVAKAADREELYRTLIVEGVHICGLLEFLMHCTACQRRQTDQAPRVLAPVRLNIQNAEITRAELVEAVEKKFDLNLRKPLEKKLIGYQVGEDSDYYRRYELRERIDPYLDYDVETKLFMKSEARLTMQTDGPEYELLVLWITLSIHFNAIVSRELLKGDGFWNLDTNEQSKRMLAAAKLLTAVAKPVTIDPKTGLPAKEESQLVPTIDLKNQHQLG